MVYSQDQVVHRWNQLLQFELEYLQGAISYSRIIDFLPSASPPQCLLDVFPSRGYASDSVFLPQAFSEKG
jgi:hypothetical protein